MTNTAISWTALMSTEARCSRLKETSAAEFPWIISSRRLLILGINTSREIQAPKKTKPMIAALIWLVKANDIVATNERAAITT